MKSSPKQLSTDWIASTPIFFNKKNRKFSTDIHDVIDYGNIEIDEEGLLNYLEFGFSVFGYTPIKDVEFLLPNQEVSIHDGEIIIRDLKDPAEKFFHNTTTPREVISLFEQSMNNWEATNTKNIIIPLSGGFDSRFISSFLKDKKNIKAFSYGVSPLQNDSFEVMRAQMVAKKLGIDWEDIKLGDFNQYIDKWVNFYGPSVHAHGMYHLEFFSKIRSMIPSGKSVVISGLAGDAWAGNFHYSAIKDCRELIKLGHNHGVGISPEAFVNQHKYTYASSYWNKNSHLIQDERLQILAFIRMKIMLLQYLLTAPKMCGLDSWSPFLNVDICMKMLNIDEKHWNNRKWQKEYFKQMNLDVENSSTTYSMSNTLDMQSLRNSSFKPLISKKLGNYVKQDYIDAVNCSLSKFNPSFLDKLISNHYYLGAGLRKLGFTNTTLKMYYSYLILKPIDDLLFKSE